MPIPLARFRLPALLMALLVVAGGALAAPAGTVVGVNGEAFVEGAGGRAALKLGQAVQVGDTVDVPASARLKLRMSDGSVVSLAAGTRMTIGAYHADAAGQREQAKLSLAQGLLRAVVAPVQRAASFEVDTAVGTAAVRSTDWFVQLAGGVMQVGVLAGSVDMTSAATRRTVTIPARWGARLEAGRDPVPPRVWSAAEFDDVTARTDVK
jgi:hypothetical protein